MILFVSVFSAKTGLASRWVSVRKKTSAATKGKREHASAPTAPIYPYIEKDGIDRRRRVEESKTRIVGSESVDKEAKMKHDLRPGGARERRVRVKCAKHAPRR